MYKNKKLKIAYYFSKGKKAPIVFIHGLGDSKKFFNDVWKHKNFSEHSILTFDLIGFGNSSNPKGFSYKVEDHAEICSLLINKLGLTNINLVGHSFGGAISLLLIEKIKPRISSFVNVEGNLISEDCTMSREISDYPIKDFKKYGFEKIKNEIKMQEDLQKNPKAAQIWQSSLSKSSAIALHKSSVSLVRWSESGKLLKLFNDLIINKCYIYGELNKDLKVLEKIPKIKRLSIAKSGHFMMIDNPKDFYGTLSKLLKKWKNNS